MLSSKIKLLTSFFQAIFIYYPCMMIFGTLHALATALCGFWVMLGLPLLSFKSTKPWCRRYTYACLRVFALSILGLSKLLRCRFEIHNPIAEEKNKNHLLICNHQSWFDILIILCCFQKSLPPLKFFPKKELKKVPFVGAVCTAMGNPFIDRRNRERAIASIQEACEEFKNEYASYIIYVEGTRFTPEKKRAQSKNPFQYLLLPKGRGLSVTLSALTNITEILDLTLIFPKHCKGLPDYLGGRVRTIQVWIHRRPVTPDLYDPEACTAQVMAWWHEKDALITQHQL